MAILRIKVKFEHNGQLFQRTQLPDCPPYWEMGADGEGEIISNSLLLWDILEKAFHEEVETTDKFDCEVN